MGSPDRSRPSVENPVQTAKEFKAIVQKATGNPETRYHVTKENGIVHAAASVSISNGPKIEFLHCNPRRAGSSVDIQDIAAEGLFLDLDIPDDQREGIIPTDAIVLSDKDKKTRTTFCLYEDGSIVRTHVVGSSSETSIGIAGPSSSDLGSLVKVSRVIDPVESRALITYATSPHLYPEAAEVATQLNREEQGKVDAAIADAIENEREYRELLNRLREERFKDRE